MKKANLAVVILGVLFGSLVHSFGQTNIQIISIVPTVEQAMQLTWTSVSNEVYQIDEADALETNSDGSTTWNVLYTGYPSQGTNTFWLDTGNYDDVPPIVHPKYSPMRFYLIVDSGPDTASDEPVVSITSPTNGLAASGSLTITVSASTDQPVLSGTKLYVDGQEMQMRDSSTNYVSGSTNNEVDTYTINTCEWPNGPHILFATTTCYSALQGPSGNIPVATGHGVSGFVPVTFNNLVTRISFSQPFFDPAAGQTQQVTALFPSNCNWTLNIVDIASNIVRTASGSGGSMAFNWDGTGTNGSAVPPGVYHYLISAQTNGLPLGGGGGGSGGGGGGPPPPDFAGSVENGAVVGASTSEESLLPPWPPGLPVPRDAEGREITSIVVLEEPASASPVSSKLLVVGGATPDGSPAPDDSSSTPPPGSQNSPPAPVRPPPAPVAGVSGTFGMAYDDYEENGTNGYTLALPLNAFGFPPIQLDGLTANGAYGPLPLTFVMMDYFAARMKTHSWLKGFSMVNNQLTANALIGSGTPFNSVDLGVLATHGSYGSGPYPDWTANGCKQMYFPITAGQGAQYVRMSQMNFGGSGTHGLKWMALWACNSLRQSNWRSMQSANITPYNNNLHMLLGTDSSPYNEDDILLLWAANMFGDKDAKTPNTQLTIQAAWYQGARSAYAEFGDTYPAGTVMTYATAGDQACEGDTIQANSSPTGTPFYDSNQVYP